MITLKLDFGVFEVAQQVIICIIIFKEIYVQ